MNVKYMIPKFLRSYYINTVYKNFTKNEINILNDEETLRIITNEKKSIVRFGDGEFKWILGIKQESFQQYSKKMAQRLLEILKSTNDDKVLICIPEGLKRVDSYIESSQMFWKNFVRWYGKKILPFLDTSYLYGNTNFTRWYVEYRDKSNMDMKVKKLKSIWDDKEILIIEGKDTKLGVGNDLFSNCKNIERIIAPSQNAFEQYENILKITKNVEKNKMILIALGPTATILAFDLAQLGYQAIDVGHIDIEYEWYLRKTNKKIPIDGKYVNEAGGMNSNLDFNDVDYEKSIIASIGEKEK